PRTRGSRRRRRSPRGWRDCAVRTCPRPARRSSARPGSCRSGAGCQRAKACAGGGCPPHCWPGPLHGGVSSRVWSSVLPAAVEVSASVAKPPLKQREPVHGGIGCSGTAWLGAVGGARRPGVVGPGVPRVAPLHLLPDLGVGALPEPAQVGG